MNGQVLGEFRNSEMPRAKRLIATTALLCVLMWVFGAFAALDSAGDPKANPIGALLIFGALGTGGLAYALYVTFHVAIIYTTEGVTLRKVLRTRTIPWSELASIACVPPDEAARVDFVRRSGKVTYIAGGGLNKPAIAAAGMQLLGEYKTMAAAQAGVPPPPAKGAPDAPSAARAPRAPAPRSPHP